MENLKRLYKSRHNKIIDGVCGGFAEYLNTDPTVVRIVWVLLTLLGGAGFILYIAAMIIMPTNPEQYPPKSTTSDTSTPTEVGTPSETRRLWGIIIILLGTMILMFNLGWFVPFNWWEISWKFFFPIVLITVGVWIMFTTTRKPTEATLPPQEKTTMETQRTQQPRLEGIKEFRRSITDRKLFGVCGGIANYFNVDPTIIRILYIILTLTSLGWGILLYIILALIMPEEKVTTTS